MQNLKDINTQIQKKYISLAIDSAKGIFSTTKNKLKKTQMKGCLNQKFQLHS